MDLRELVSDYGCPEVLLNNIKLFEASYHYWLKMPRDRYQLNLNKFDQIYFTILNGSSYEEYESIFARLIDGKAKEAGDASEPTLDYKNSDIIV